MMLPTAISLTAATLTAGLSLAADPVLPGPPAVDPPISSSVPAPVVPTAPVDPTTDLPVDPTIEDRPAEPGADTADRPQADPEPAETPADGAPPEHARPDAAGAVASPTPTARQGGRSATRSRSSRPPTRPTAGNPSPQPALGAGRTQQLANILTAGGVLALAAVIATFFLVLNWTRRRNRRIDNHYGDIYGGGQHYGDTQMNIGDQYGGGSTTTNLVVRPSASVQPYGRDDDGFAERFADRWYDDGADGGPANPPPDVGLPSGPRLRSVR